MSGRADVIIPLIAPQGPTLAFACAAAELLEAGKLDVDLVMLIEGEEEAGSVGFEQAVLDNRAAIGPIDVVALSNSYWLGTRQPCMTFGLRGVIHATVKVSSTRQDLHSGQFGGSVDEPMADLVRLLSSLLDDRSQIKLAGFYDAVRPLESEEKALYDELFARLDVCVGAAVSCCSDVAAAISHRASAGPRTTAIRS